MFSTIKNSVSGFFSYIKDSFAEMRARPWTILKYAVVWPVLLVLGLLWVIAGFLYVVSLILPEGKVDHSEEVIYIDRDKSDW